jgi:hypothetical protein
MIKNFLNIKDKKRTPAAPVKEKTAKAVPAQRFNEMIDYYTHELKSRLEEIKRLKEENEMLVKTSIKNAARSDEQRLQVKKLQEDVRMLQQRLQDRK